MKICTKTYHFLRYVDFCNKIYFLDAYMNFFHKKFSDISDKHGKYYHQNIAVIEVI